jgi:MYXO-CTERM domain-containing protein
VSFAVSPPEGDVRWPFLLLWPLALAALLTWRRRRLEV